MRNNIEVATARKVSFTRMPLTNELIIRVMIRKFDIRFDQFPKFLSVFFYSIFFFKTSSSFQPLIICRVQNLMDATERPVRNRTKNRRPKMAPETQKWHRQLKTAHLNRVISLIALNVRNPKKLIQIVQLS